VMTKNPYAAQGQTSLAYIAHLMEWERIEVVPVVNASNEVEGLVSRQDVIKALNEVQRQPQVGESIHDLIVQNLDSVDEIDFQTEVTPQMTNELGTLSNGVLTTLVSEASSRLLLELKRGKMVAESLNIYFIEPIQMDSKLTLKPELL